MKAAKPEIKQRNCPSCGAPVTSEICPYCGVATGLNSAEADMEYPVLECREISIDSWNIKFPLIFAAAFGLGGILFFIIAMVVVRNILVGLILLPFIITGVVTAISPLRMVFRYIRVKTLGKTIQATVYGYLDDDMLINNRPAQIVKLLIKTPDGPRFVLYQLENTLKPYGMHDIIDVMVYKDDYMICKNRRAAHWE